MWGEVAHALCRGEQPRRLASAGFIGSLLGVLVLKLALGVAGRRARATA